MRNKMSLLIYAIIGLAVVGLFSQLFKNTLAFLQSIIITIIVAAVMVAVIRYFLQKRSGISTSSSNDMKKYKQAVKQSKLKYSKKQKQPATTTSKSTLQSMKRRHKANHLRVIDGGNKTSNNKPKRNNRATY